MSAIVINHLTIAYKEKPVLWDVNASIEQGVLLAIVGPNGAGKTTLLKAMVGLIKPLAGSINFFGNPVDKATIAYVPQRSSIDWDFPLHVIDLVLMGCYRNLGWFSRPGKKEYMAAYQALERVGMKEYAHVPIGQLSGGQQQRVFIARALLQDAPCYLLDEPFNAIDSTTEHLITQLLQELCAAGKTIVVVHHNLHAVQNYFNWVLLLNTTAIACGPIQSIFTPDLLQMTFGKQIPFTV